MAKFVDWIKKYKWHITFIALSVVIVFAIIGCVVLGCLSEDVLEINNKTLWITFLCAVATAAASLLVGVIAFWQNKQMRELSDSKDTLTREENEKQRKQDLLIRTNPKAVFEKIDSITFDNEACYIICDREQVNRLTDATFHGSASFGKVINMNLIFNTNANVDSIYVSELVISKLDTNFWPSKSQNFINPSKTPYGLLKVIENNKVKLFIQLLWNQMETKDSFLKREKHPLDDLDEADNIWSVTFRYKVSNDFSGASNQYQTQFYFKNLSGNKNKYHKMEDTLDEKPLDIEMIEDRTTTWIIKEETQNGQAEDDVDGQGE